MATTEAEIEQLRSDIHKLRSDIEHIGATIGRVARAGAREAGDSMCDATEGVRNEVRRTAQSLTKKIEENPIAAAVGALTLGMLLGRLCTGRRG
jgi:hypothetical protein